MELVPFTHSQQVRELCQLSGHAVWRRAKWDLNQRGIGDQTSQTFTCDPTARTSKPIQPRRKCMDLRKDLGKFNPGHTGIRKCGKASQSMLIRQAIQDH